MDMRFGTSNARNFYGLDSLKIVLRELAKYKFD
jgi:hypothetical protein